MYRRVTTCTIPLMSRKNKWNRHLNALLDFKRTSKLFEKENCSVLFKLEVFRLLWTELCASELCSVRDVVWEIVEQDFS